MDKRKQDKRSSGRVQAEKAGGRVGLEQEEDYGDYVTRCICGFKHDDGYMICCDECSVWQHLDCMQVDPKNLPENYLCEQCEPRPVDKRRAHKIQLKKREDFSEADENRQRKRERSQLPRTPQAGLDARRVTTSTVSSTTNTPLAGAKKRKKRGKPESKVESLKKIKKEKGEDGPASSSGIPGKRRRRGAGKGGASSSSSIQSLLTAASLLEEGTHEEEEEEEEEHGHSHSHLWSAEKSPWTDKYECAEENVFSEVVGEYISRQLDRLRSEAVVYTHEEYARGLGPHVQEQTDQTTPPQWTVVDVAPSRRGVVVRDSVPQDELVMEYKGRVTVIKEVLGDVGISGRSVSSLWKLKPCPFVYVYDKMSHLDLCIDARNYGNDARFIRRSCVPSAELRHFFVDNELHFGVYALDHLSQDEEVTLPYDFHGDKCQYVVECGCGQTDSACLMASGSRVHLPVAPGVSSRKSSGVTTDEEHVSARNRNVSLHKSHSHVFTDDDSNMSWTSTSSVGRRKTRLQHPQSPAAARETSSLQASRGASSDSDEREGGEGEEPEKPRKSLSREERKTEQVWRVFEKMEASARKRQQLLSEGSHESDPASDPSPIHRKDRRLSSSSSRKVQMLSRPHHMSMCVRRRPSSVSSMDPLSPYEPSEPFSPPMTPGQPPPYSPLQSPPIHYHLAPQLHPKYLFARVALPWKKAVLYQWEKEQRTGCKDVPRSYWDSNLPVYGYQVAEDTFRIRPRGCLKHRWLKSYQGETHQPQGAEGEITADSDTKGCGQARKQRPPPLSSLTESGSDKENHGNQVTLPHKKQVLLRWSEFSKANQATPTQDPVDATTKPRAPLPSVSRKSPFFDEFSDGEEMGGCGVGGDSSLLWPEADKEAGGGVAKEEATDLSSPSTPPLSALIGDHFQFVSLVQQEGTAPAPVAMDTSGGVAREKGSEERGSRGEDEDVQQQLSGISDISLDSPSEEERGVVSHNTDGAPIEKDDPSALDPAGPVDISDVSSEGSGTTPPPQNTTPLPAEGAMRSADVVAMESSLLETAAMATSKLEVSTDDHAKVAEIESGGSGQTDSGCGPPESGTGMSDTSALAPPTSPPSAQPTPLKTPAKRKINLSEYRNRAARRPADRKGSSEKVSTPPNTPGTPSFLASHPSLFPPVGSSPYTTPTALQLSSGPLQSQLDSAPHFEPVSPDDDDHISKVSMREDATSASLIAGRGVPPPLGVASTGGVSSSMTYSCTPGSNLYNPYATAIQNKNVLPGGMAQPGLLPGAIVGGVTGLGVPGAMVGPLAGGVTAPGGVAGIVAGGLPAGSLQHGGGVAGGYGGMQGIVQWVGGVGGADLDPRGNRPGAAPVSSGGAITISTAPSHLQPPGLLQHHQGAVQGLNFPSQSPQVATVAGSSYPHQPPLPSNSGGVFLNQLNHGSVPGGMYPGGHPRGYFRPQQQPLNPPPPGNQGGGPGLYRPRRPHPSNLGGNNNPYY